MSGLTFVVPGLTVKGRGGPGDPWNAKKSEKGLREPPHLPPSEGHFLVFVCKLFSKVRFYVDCLTSFSSAPF